MNDEPYDISITRPARWRIRRGGGAVWVWTAPLGDSAWEMIHASTRAPHSAEYDRVELDGIDLWLPPELPMRKFTIGWSPVTGLEVTWAGTPGPAPFPNGG